MKIGVNQVVISYLGMSAIVDIVAHGIVELEAEYCGGVLFEGDSISNADFFVEAIYDNGERVQLDDFNIEADGLTSGINMISIRKEKISTDCTIYVHEDMQATATVQGRFAHYNVSSWDTVDDYDINGMRHDSRGKKFALGDMWHDFDANNCGVSALAATIFVPLNPNKDDDSYFTGTIIMDYSMKDTETIGEICFKAGENILFTTGIIGGDTRNSIDFCIETKDIDSFEIITTCELRSEEFVYAILYD